LAPYVVHENWANFLVARDMLCGLKPKCPNNKILVEAYNPHCVARQSSLIQDIPSFMTSTFDVLTRPTLG